MLCKQGRDLAAREPEKAIKIYSKAIALYKGDYLPECAYDEWELPIRSYYRHIYLQSALELLRLLHNKQRYDAIIKICETVFAIELFEEDFHIYFIDALFALGKIKEARSHYEYITSLFYRELGVKPSLAMARNRLAQNRRKRFSLNGNWHCFPRNRLPAYKNT